MDFTVSVTTDARTLVLERALVAYRTVKPDATEEEFVQALVDAQLDIMVPQYLKPIITHLDFLDRFTVDERIAVRTAAQTNPIVADFLDLLNAVKDRMVDLTDQRTINGVNALESMALISTGRAAQILAL